MAKPKLIIALGDTHCNSRLGLCPPEGVRLPEGGRYLPSDEQLWLWNAVYVPMWAEAERLKAECKADGIVVLNGDLADYHVKGALIHNSSPEVVGYITQEVFAPVKRFRPSKVYVLRGTASHVGEEGDPEEAVGRMLKAEKDPTTDTWTSQERYISAHGVLFHFTHHGRVGGKDHTQQSHAANMAADIENRWRRAGREVPDVAVRSHRHEPVDSGQSFMRKTRYVVLPPLQIKTGFAFKVAADNPPSFGAVFFLVHDTGQYDVIPYIVYPDPPPVERV